MHKSELKGLQCFLLLCCCSSSPLQLTHSGLVGAAGGLDGAADVDEVVVAALGQVVEIAVGFGERRQVEGEFCRQDGRVADKVHRVCH